MGGARPKGVAIRLAANLPVDPRAAVWGEMRRRGEAPWTVREIVAATGVPLRTVEAYVLALTRAAMVAQAAKHGQWLLVRDVGRRAPRLRLDGSAAPGSARPAIWTAIRIQKAFTALDLHVSTGVPLSTVKHYLTALRRAGYLLAKTGGASGKLAHYRLDPRRNTGPEAPQVLRLRAVFDPNLAQIVWPTEADTAEVTAEGGEA